MIRKAEKKDFKQIYDLGEELHSNYRETYDFNELICKEYFHILVYMNNDEVCGFLIYTDLDDIIDIADIIVKEKYRRQKIATTLIDYMITNSKINGRLYLEVATDNKKAINLYQKFGFKIIHTRKKYYKDKDAYVMERVNNDE